jgi:hypothetical protein
MMSPSSSRKAVSPAHVDDRRVLVRALGVGMEIAVDATSLPVELPANEGGAHQTGVSEEFPSRVDGRPWMASLRVPFTDSHC